MEHQPVCISDCSCTEHIKPIFCKSPSFVKADDIQLPTHIDPGLQRISQFLYQD